VPDEAMRDNVKLAVLLDNSAVRLSPCSDGSYKIHITQKLLGVGNIELDPRRLWPNATIPYIIASSMQPYKSVIPH